MLIWDVILQVAWDSMSSTELAVFLPDQPMCLLLLVYALGSLYCVGCGYSRHLHIQAVTVRGLWMLFKNQIEITPPLSLTF